MNSNLVRTTLWYSFGTLCLFYFSNNVSISPTPSKVGYTLIPITNFNTLAQQRSFVKYEMVYANIINPTVIVLLSIHRDVITISALLIHVKQCLLLSMYSKFLWVRLVDVESKSGKKTRHNFRSYTCVLWHVTVYYIRNHWFDRQ